MTKEDHERPKKKIRFISAYDYAIKLLVKKDYSELKLRQKLSSKNYSDKEVEEAVELVKERKFLREDYYIESRAKGLLRKGYAPQYISQKLQREGPLVSPEEITQIAHENGIDLEQVKQNLIEKKLRSLRPELSEFEKKCKISAFLASKGHHF